jgi:hypothetical protein
MSSFNITSGASALKVKGMSPDKDVSVTFTAVTRDYPASEEYRDTLDGRLLESYAAHTTEGELDFTLSGNLEGLKVSLVSTPFANVQNHSIKGNSVVMESSGNPTFSFQTENEYGKRIYNQTYIGTVTPRSEFRSVKEVEYTVGTLAREATNNICSNFCDILPGLESNCQFINGGSYAIGGTSVVKNPSFALAEYDWSGISLARSIHPSCYFPAILVSPRHAIVARHVDGGLPVVGSTCLFQRADGSQITATILESDVNSDPGTDLALVYFDRDLTGCKFYKILPEDYTTKLPSQVNVSISDPKVGFPVAIRVVNTGDLSNPVLSNIYLDSNSPKFILQDVELFDDTNIHFTGGLEYNQLLRRHWRVLYGGDSGSPAFLLARESYDRAPEPILLSALYTAGTATNLAAKAQWLDTKMQAQAALHSDVRPYAMSRADLSGYTSFSV